MNYCIVDENNIINNIVVCDDDETAKLLGAVKGYDMARIGDLYDPYNYHALAEANDKIAELNTLVNMLTGVTE